MKTLQTVVTEVAEHGDCCSGCGDSCDARAPKPQKDARAVMTKRYMKVLGMTQGEATELYADVVRFVDLAKDENSVPPKKIDEGWHEFVLHTRLYADFCRSRYGKFIHHQPSDGTKPEEFWKTTYRKTLQNARTRFGELSSNWKNHAGCGSDCGSGDNCHE